SGAGTAGAPNHAAPAPPPAAPPSSPQAPTGSATAPAAAPATPTAPAIKRGRTIRTGHASTYPHLDPHQTTSSFTAGYGVGLWFSRLVKVDVRVPVPATIPVPDLAESWEQPDDTTYLFKLRANARWQNISPVNGRAVTVDDLLYSLDRIRTPGFPNASALGAVAKIEAVDRMTIKLSLSRPGADFLVDLSGGNNAILAKENVE